MIKIIPIKLDIEFVKGMDIAEIIINSFNLEEKDIIVIAHKIVSKVEGRVVKFNDIKPSSRAIELAKEHNKDARVVEVILNEAMNIIRASKGVIITETKHGFICANSAVDRSNVRDGLVLLPEDPDRSAFLIRKRIKELTDKDVAVIISDTFGRAFREGQVNVAIGICGIKPLKDYRGMRDPYDNELKVTNIAIADELASAAELVMNKLDKTPIAVIRGYDYEISDCSIKMLIRDKDRDLFR